MMDVWAGGDPGTNAIFSNLFPLIGGEAGNSYLSQWLGLDSSGSLDWGQIWAAARNLPVVDDTIKRADKILHPFVRDVLTPGGNPNWSTIEDSLQGMYSGLSRELASWLDPLVGIGTVALEDMGGAVLGSYETGTDYVPRTGPYMLHKGESVNTVEETSRKDELLKTIKEMKDEITSANLKLISLAKEQSRMNKRWNKLGIPIGPTV